MSEIEIKETADTFIKSTPSNTNSVQHFSEIHAGAGTESMHVTNEGLFIGAETYTDAPFKVPFTGKIKVGSATIYFEWDGSAFNVVGGTITGGTIQTATTGYRIKLNGSNNKIELLYNDTVKGSILLDGSNSVIIDTADNIYFRNGATELAQLNENGITLPSGKKVQFSSGTTITDAGSECQIDRQLRVHGTVYPSSNEDHNCGASDKAWDTVYAQNFTDTSAREKKENLRSIESPLDKVLSMNAYRFNWIKGQKESVGLMADEMEEILPEIVSKDEYGKACGIEYNKLVTVLIEAVKEQQSQIDQLKKMLKPKDTIIDEKPIEKTNEEIV